MSDDQSDFPGKTRRAKAVEIDSVDTSEREKSIRKAARKAQRVERRTLASADSGVVAPATAASLSTEDLAAAKAERKAEKAANKANRKAQRAIKKENRRKDQIEGADGAAARGGDEHPKAKTDRKALRAAKKADRKEDAAAERAPMMALNSEGNDKARRKARKAAKKTSRKAERAADKTDKEIALADDKPSDAVSAEEKAKAKAERKAEKAAKKALKNRNSEGGDEEASEAGERARRKGGKFSDENDDTDGPGSLRIALRGLKESAASKIRAHIEMAFSHADVTLEWANEDQKAHLAIYGFENASVGPEQIGACTGAIAKDRSKFRIFVGRAGFSESGSGDSFAAENAAIATLTSALHGAFIDTASLFRRHGMDKAIHNSELTDFGANLIVVSVLGVAAGRRISRFPIPRPQLPAPDDLAVARALSAADLLSQLNWSSPIIPKLLWTRASKESVQAFLDREVALSEELSLSLDPPIAWPADVPSRLAETQILGLEFLSGPLNYWYGKANNRNTRQSAEIDVLVKERGVTAGEILARAGKIILDFADSYPLASGKAWEENAVSRRARVLALFVLCCKVAAKRKVKFDEDVFMRVFNELLNLIEVLRSADLYQLGSLIGVEQDSLVAGLALTLCKTAYAERLLIESMDRLKTLQLNVALTTDGVWRTGTFSDHCMLLSQFRIMLGDFDSVDSSLKEPIAAAAKKMTVFAEALLKSNGSPPVFDNSSQKSFLKNLEGTRRALAGAGFSKNAPQKGKPMPRITDTYVFRDAQYFASHTSQNPSSDSSLVVLCREPSSFLRDDPGGMSLAFAHGEKDLLVCADPVGGTEKGDKAALLDTALRNGYRVNGIGYAPDQDIKPSQARLVKSWRGEGWAAAKGIDETNPAASVLRTIVHLKNHHALIVVDELRTADGNEAVFEQFWHIAPGLASPSSASVPLCFARAEGNLAVAFDASLPTALEPEGEDGTCVRRTFSAAKGVVAALFQWSNAPVPAALTALSATGSNWSIEASGAGFDVRISLNGETLQYEPKAAA